jgi:hypothetical protein
VLFLSHISCFKKQKKAQPWGKLGDKLKLFVENQAAITLFA